MNVAAVSGINPIKLYFQLNKIAVASEGDIAMPPSYTPIKINGGENLMIKEVHVSKNLWSFGNVSIAVGERLKTFDISLPSNTYTIKAKYSSTNTGSVTIGIYDENEQIHTYNSTQIDGTVSCSYTGIITAIRLYAASGYSPSASYSADFTEIMLNTGATALPYEPYGDTWNTKSYSKIVDTTQQVTSFPVVVRPMENTIPSWTIKGNMVQDGTPSPSNIIYPSETGDRTGNLFDKTDYVAGKYIDSSGNEQTSSSGINNHSDYIAISANTEYTLTSNKISYTNITYAIAWYDSDKTFISRDSWIAPENAGRYSFTATSPINAAYAIFNFTLYPDYTNERIMLNTGSTALPYEPYGYKLDIKSANTTTPVYLGQVVSTRRIKKLVLTGEEGWVRTQNQKCYYVNASTGCPTDYLKQTITTSICSHYQSQNNTASGSNEVEAGHFCFFTGGGFELYIGETTISSAADFKTYLQQQYANGTPVTVWYVLATPTTTTLNEPLRKIGTYSDSVSGTNLAVIAQSPTTIDVDTSLKPSEMDLTYTGMKMCGRKKYVHGNSLQVMPSATAETKELNGVTVSCNGNGVYTLSGTASKTTEIFFDLTNAFTTPVSIGQGGNGTMSLFNTYTHSGSGAYIIFYKDDVAVDNWNLNSANRTSTGYVTLGNKEINKVSFRFSSGVSTGGTVSPMFTDDGQLPVTYQPYLQWQ